MIQTQDQASEPLAEQAFCRGLRQTFLLKDLWSVRWERDIYIHICISIQLAYVDKGIYVLTHNLWVSDSESVLWFLYV